VDEVSKEASVPNNSAATFRSEVESAINRCSMENGSDTPDWILARFLQSCLEAFDAAVRDRETWWGRVPNRGPGYVKP
jgi:hypothetical protein